MKWAWVLGLSSLVGCTLVLDWDKNQLPCDSEQECLDGYTCLGTACIADSSVAEGGSCNNDVQCGSKLICDHKRFRCFEPCSTFYRSTSDCDGQYFCADHPVEDPVTGVSTPRGACVPSECTNDDSCNKPNRPAGEICVKITSSASACILGCDVDWTGAIDNTYSNNCGSTPSEPKYCQPIGLAKRLVCLPTSNAGEGEDDLCEPIESPCRELTEAGDGPVTGLACVDSQCRRHCKPQALGGSGSQCVSGLTCVPHVGEDVTFGICESL